jgi:hypothetical protein
MKMGQKTAQASGGGPTTASGSLYPSQAPKKVTSAGKVSVNELTDLLCGRLTEKKGF